MKTFSQFILEADSSASDASSAISRSGSGVGGSGAGGPLQGGFKKRRLPIEFKKKEREVTEPEKKEPQEPTKDTSYRGQGVGRTDKVGGPQTQQTPQSKGRALPPAKERPALPSSRDSMVAKRTASAQQPPQHKQISARPASTAMAGSRQRPAIRPGQSSITNRTTSTPARRPDIQGVRVRDVTQRPKALPSGQRQVSGSPQRRQLPPARS